MSAEHLEEVELRFEEEIARMRLPLLLKFAAELELELVNANKKSQVLRELRQNKSTWHGARAKSASSAT